MGLSKQDSISKYGTEAYTGWGETEAAADAASKGLTGGGGNSSGQVTPANLVDLENKVFEQLKPYYMQLLQEANGDFEVAKNKLTSDYTTNTRDAKIAYTTGTTDELANLKNTLDQNTITNTQDQEGTIDKLNQRGMAVYQQGPEQALNVLGVHLPIGDATDNAITDPNAGINPLYSSPNNPNLGQGGNELTRLQQDQQLRQEAQQRATNQKLTSLGLNYTQSSKTPTGYDLSTPAGVAAATADINSGKAKLSDFGTEGQNAINSYNNAAQNNRQTTENLNQNLQSQVATQGANLAQSGAKEQDVNAQNTLNKNEQQLFVNQGI